MAPFLSKLDKVLASSCKNKIDHTKNWKILKNLSIFIFSSDHPKNFRCTIEFDHTPPESTMANQLALSLPILDDAIKRYFQNKTKNSKSHFFWWGSKISFDGIVVRPRTQRQSTRNGRNRVRECNSQFIWAIFDSPSLCFHFTKKLVKLKIQQLNCCITLF